MIVLVVIVLVVIVLVVIVLVVIVLVVIVLRLPACDGRWAMGDGRWPMQAQEPLRITLHVLFAQ